MNKSNLLLRLLTALVGAFIIILCIMISPWAFFGLVLLIAVLSIREYIRLAGLLKNQIIWLYLSAVVCVTLLFLVASDEISPKYLAILLPVFSIGLIIQLYQNDERPLRSMALLYLGIGYIILPFGLLSFIGFHDSVYSPYLLLALFILTWSMDTGAYFAGTLLGRHKLFESVSPKKSWEGAIGGFLLVMIGAWVFSLYVDRLTLGQWLATGATIAITGIYGDLVESFIKRVAMAKDSGTSIPGHGGFLDRFDSLIFAIPFYLLLLQLL